MIGVAIIAIGILELFCIHRRQATTRRYRSW